MHAFSNCSIVILHETEQARYPRSYRAEVEDDVAGPANDEIAV